VAKDKQMSNRDLTTGVQLVDRLLEAADGGREVRLGEYYASTILAIFEDSMFRSRVLSGHSDILSTSTSDPNEE